MEISQLNMLVINFLQTLDNLGITTDRLNKPGYILEDDLIIYFMSTGIVDG